MALHCQAQTTITRMRSGWWTPVAFIGGSLTVGTGCSNTSMCSWRKLFMRYIHDRYEQVYHFRVGDVMAAIGAMSSYGMSFMMPKYVPRQKPTLAFLEHCVNDCNCPHEGLVEKGIEGLVRQLRGIDSNPDIVILCAPTRPDCEACEKTRATLEVHRRVAEHYGATVIDVHEYLHRTLASRGQTWDDVGIDNYHMNDYGNHIWFECLRDWFEQQVRVFEQDLSQPEPRTMPEPLHSDELEHTKLVTATKKSKRIVLEGDWGMGEDVSKPWWMDGVLVGRPGAKVTYTFTGTAIATVTMMYPNGLKMEAVLDGEEVVGPYTNWVADFGSFGIIRHGMEDTEHTLELTVAGPQKGKNQEDPTARLAYFCSAG